MRKKTDHLGKLILTFILVGAQLCAIANESDISLRKASILVATGQFKDAIAILKQYEPKDREDELAISVLTGKIYLAIDRPAKALEFFEDAQAQSLESFDAAIGAAHANLKLGKFKEAERHAQAAKKIDNDSAEPDFISAVIGLRTGNPSRSNDSLVKLSTQRPESESVLIVYAKFLTLTGESLIAKQNAANFLSRAPNSPDVQDYLADLEYQSGNKTEGIRLKKIAAQLYEKQGKLFKRDIIFSWLDVNHLPTERPSAPVKPEGQQAVVPQPKTLTPPVEPNSKADAQVATAKPKVAPAPADPQPKLVSEIPTPKSIVSPQPVLTGLKLEQQPSAPKPRVDSTLNPEAVKVANAARKETRLQTTYLPENEFATPVQRFPFPPNVMITGGSGFIVDGGKKVVTNRHVIEDGKEFAIRTGLGEVIKVRVVFISQSDDIAVLELEKPLPADRAIPVGAYSKPRVGRNVVVMGYPLWYMLGEGSPSLTNGMVSKRTGLKDDMGTFQLTAKVNKGNSGGPVFDLFGNVVGITVGKLDNKKIQTDEGFVPEDVNFAIHVDRMPAIANAKVSSSESDGAELSTEELYQVMLGKVVMVATYK